MTIRAPSAAMETIMRKELDYFWVGEEYGGRQSLLPDFIMRFAGCAAVTACDSLIYMTLYKNKKGLCPFSTYQLRGRDYVNFFRTVNPISARVLGASKDWKSLWTDSKNF